MNALNAALLALNRHAESLWQTLSDHLPGFSVEVLPSVDSTNTELMRRARLGDHHPTLLVAAEQTAGRGRQGKSWISQPGASLTFSLGLPLAPLNWSGLSLAVGVSLAETLHPDVRLKWPNDLWWHGRKLGGILVETASVGPQRYAVIGVGLNLLCPPIEHLPAPAADALPPAPPCGLADLPLSPQDAGAWMAQLVPPLVQAVQAFERTGFDTGWQRRFITRDALLGKPVRLSDGREGEAAGIAPDGALLLRTADGLSEITSAEVSVRPC